MGGRRRLWLNVGVKALLVGLLVFLAFSDLEGAGTLIGATLVSLAVRRGDAPGSAPAA